jgi:5-methylcytosine-specific restriction endonuclease McrBC regulatory subunit McrC
MPKSIKLNISEDDWKKLKKDMRAQFVKATSELWDAHFDDARKILGESEATTLNLNFTAAIDLSESKGKMTTKIRYSQVTTDDRVAEFDNPNQLQMDEVNDEARKQSRNGRKRTTSEGAASEDPASN